MQLMKWWQLMVTYQFEQHHKFSFARTLITFLTNIVVLSAQYWWVLAVTGCWRKIWYWNMVIFFKYADIYLCYFCFVAHIMEYILSMYFDISIESRINNWTFGCFLGQNVSMGGKCNVIKFGGEPAPKTWWLPWILLSMY